MPALIPTRSLRLASLAVMTATIASLAACGGGGGGSPTPPPPPPPPPGPPATVTSATATATTYNQPALVTVNGTNLDATLLVSSPACSSMTRLTAAPNASTSTTAYYSCTLSNYAGTVTIASPAGTTLGSATFSAAMPAITSATAATTRFNDPALITVNGTNLDSGLVPSSPNCTNMTLLTTGQNVSSSTTAYYHCTIAGAYSGSVTFANAVGAAMIPSASFTVPAPIVTMAVTNGAGVNGNLVISLAGDKAPVTVDNFLAYVNTGFYDNTIFHRIVSGFIAQAGGYAAPVTNISTATPKTPTFAPIPLETTGGSNAQWTLSMARTNNPNSATSQFFINLANNTNLDSTNSVPGYAVFGSLTTSSVAVAQAIVAAPASCAFNSAANSLDCLPTPNVVITSAVQTQ